MCSFPREPHFLIAVLTNLKESLISTEVERKLWKSLVSLLAQSRSTQGLTQLSFEEWRSPTGLSGLLFQRLTVLVVKSFS